MIVPLGPRREGGNVLLRATGAAMVLGVGAGWALEASNMSAATEASVLGLLHLPSAIFLRLVRMLVAPLILSVLVVGVSGMDGAGSVGRVGLRAVGWFLLMSAAAILTGLLLVNVLEPGAALRLARPAAGLTALKPPAGVAMLEELVPASVFEAMSTNRVIQIVVFAIFAGVAVGSLGERAAMVRDFAGQTMADMPRIAGYVMLGAPLAVFSALAATTLEHGMRTVSVLGALVVECYVGYFVMAVVVLAAGACVVGPRILGLLRAMREPLLIAFSTASSEATYPLALQALVRFGVDRRVAGLVLPLGYAFNLDGSLVYSSMAAIFIAQAYGIEMPLTTQLGLMAFLLLANKGAAGVPRGGLIGLTATMQAFDIPVAGVALILGVDALLDMGRTAVNVWGNAVATAAVSRMQGDLAPDCTGTGSG